MAKKRIPYLHERHGKLYVRIMYRDSAGVRRAKERQVSDTDEAIRAISEIKEDLGIYGAKALDGDRMTIEQLLAQYKRAHPDKPRWYLDPIEEFFKGRRIRTITYGDCRRFKESREQIKDRRYKNLEDQPPRKTATINRELDPLKSILIFAVRHGWLKINPFNAGPQLIEKDQEERRERIPTPAEEAAILAVCVPPREHLRGLVVATLDTGLRRSALQELTWSCVDFENRLLKVPRGNKYKGRPKLIGLTDRLESVLRELFEKSDKKPESEIFGDHIDFKRSWGTACRLAGVEGLRFNDLRHAFSTGLMEAGIPEHLAMKAAGHSNRSIHDIYTNIDQRIAHQVAAALDRLHRSRSGEDFGEAEKGTLIN